jgi:3,4-dihydroxy 2-butanone 4-phosphate synthase/GTP cyclohydrolase II
MVKKSTPLHNILDAINDIRQGKIVIVVDDEDRENEGDFVCAAEHVTPELINFMTQYGRGLVCAPITEERAHKLELPLMVTTPNTSSFQTPFTISVDLLEGNTTGISCTERARTLKALADDSFTAKSFSRPGHIFPLVARSGGVLERQGHTEAAVDLARLAGLKPAAVICEVLKGDGEMARRPQLHELAKKFDLSIISIEELVHYRQQQQNNDLFAVERIPFPCETGTFDMVMFQHQNSTQRYHFALVKGQWEEDESVLVRVHSQCFTGDIFGSFRCDCGEQLQQSLRAIEQEGRGALVYLKQEGRGIGAIEKIKAYALQDQGLDTIEANLALGHKADLRNYSEAVSMLQQLGINRVRLMTNNPDKVRQLQKGLKEVVRIPLSIPSNPFNARYITTKEERMGHWTQESCPSPLSCSH